MAYRGIALLTGSVLCIGVGAQCTFPAIAQLGPTCNWSIFLPPTAIAASLQFLGGTPPYSYHLGSYHIGTTAQNSVIFIDPTPNGGGVDYLIYATDANGCTFSAGVMWGGASSYLDIATFTQSFIAGPGSWTVRLTGGAHPSYVGPNPLCGLNYTLNRNGAFYASGTMTSIFNNAIQGFDVTGLPQGNYTMSTSVNGSTCGTFPFWCAPQVGYTSFALPQVSDTGVNVWVSAALGGAIRTGGSMIDSLRSHNLVPLMEPYSAMGYVYTGATAGASTTASILAVTGTTAAVDWVVVELRATTSPYAVLASRPALIRRDGEVMDLDGDPYVNFPGLSAGSYRVALRHRNHLGAMSSANASLQQVPVRVNLRTDIGYGTSAQTSQFGAYCLWPGDVNFDGTVRYVGSNNDRDPILTAIGGSTPTIVVTNAYSPMDVNMDGTIRYVGTNNDRDPILTTVGGSVPTATRTQQLP